MSIIKKFLVAILLFFLISSLLPNILNYKDKISFFNKIKTDYEKELKKNLQLKTEIAKKKSALEVEKTIRNQLNLSKEKEVVVIIPSPTIFPTPTPTVILKNWQKWLKVFF
ncbi:MAG: septum formation initiator family protein [Microgenomates group bacterium]